MNSAVNDGGGSGPRTPDISGILKSLADAAQYTARRNYSMMYTAPNAMGGITAPAVAAPVYDPTAAQRAYYEDSYGQSMAALAAAYEQRARAYRQNLDDSYADLQRSYDMNEQKVQNSTLAGMQGAYVNMMQNRRDLPQLLSAQGISGGMSESTLAGIRNQYGNTRNQLNTERTQAITELMGQLEQGKSAARQQYNSLMAQDAAARAQQEMSLRIQLANQLASLY